MHSHQANSFVFGLAISVISTWPALVSEVRADTIYVDDDAPSGGNGSTWATAHSDLQSALGVARTGDEIRVAAGTYRPTSGTDQMATFKPINGVAIYGGYAGHGAPDPDLRDVALYETTLSGDLLGNDGPDFANIDDNSYHVVTGSGTDATAVLNGFTITAGNAAGPYMSPGAKGGGMYNDAGSPTVTNCTFSANRARYRGGGMYNDGSSSPTLTDCTFANNEADNQDHYYFYYPAAGGGMYNYRYSSPTLINCTFSRNSARGWFGSGGGIANNEHCSPTLINCTFSDNFGGWTAYTMGVGGGMYNNSHCSPMLIGCTFSDNSTAHVAGGMYNGIHSSPTLINCTFANNSISVDDPDQYSLGGGMFNNFHCSPRLTNCTFISNSAHHQNGVAYGGGMYNADSDPTLTNCTFSGNSSTRHGGGMANGFYSIPTLINCTLGGNVAVIGGGIHTDGNANLTNCILWGNASAFGPQISGWATITYSNVQGGWPGTGNINSDPLFVDPVNGDLRLSPESPCINAGDPGDPSFMLDIGTDLDGHARVLCGRVDMGAHEFGIGDYNCDQSIDLTDFAWWNSCVTGLEPGPHDSGCDAFDFEYDGDVDLQDFAGFQTLFGSP